MINNNNNKNSLHQIVDLNKFLMKIIETLDVHKSGKRRNCILNLSKLLFFAQ